LLSKDLERTTQWDGKNEQVSLRISFTIGMCFFCALSALSALSGLMVRSKHLNSRGSLKAFYFTFDFDGEIVARSSLHSFLFQLILFPVRF